MTHIPGMAGGLRIMPKNMSVEMGRISLSPSILKLSIFGVRIIMATYRECGPL